MRFAIVRFDEPGGVRTVTDRLAADLANRGHSAELIDVPPPRQTRIRAWAAQHAPRRLLAKVPPAARASRHPDHLPSAPKTDPEVVIVSHPHLHGTFTPVSARGPVLIGCYHDSWDAALRSGHSIAIRRNYAAMDAIVLLTGADAEAASRDLGRSVIAIPNAAPELDAEISGHRPDRIVMLTRHEPQKDIQLALRAWECSRLAQEGMTLEIFGNGTLLAKHLRIVKRRRIAGVRFTRWSDDPLAELRQSLALLSTSSHEGFPSSFLEAMATGTPIITVDSAPACRELVHPDSGFLVPERSPEAVSAGLLAAAQLTPSQREDYAKASLILAEEVSRPRVTERWLRLAEGLLQQKESR
ncbi:MAG TPA: glycosyltransferase [Microbacteriaceae bacterium]|nr:glycosyltransferase [Microbacteriaceae bacterium]